MQCSAYLCKFKNIISCVREEYYGKNSAVCKNHLIKKKIVMVMMMETIARSSNRLYFFFLKIKNYERQCLENSVCLQFFNAHVQIEFGENLQNQQSALCILS